MTIRIKHESIATFIDRKDVLDYIGSGHHNNITIACIQWIKDNPVEHRTVRELVKAGQAEVSMCFLPTGFYELEAVDVTCGDRLAVLACLRHTHPGTGLAMLLDMEVAL